MADSYIGVFEFGSVVHTGNLHLSLGHDAVIVNVVGQQANLYTRVEVMGWRWLVVGWCFRWILTGMNGVGVFVFHLELDTVVNFIGDQMD